MQHWEPNQVQSVRLAVKDLYAAPKVSSDIAAGLGAEFKADDWTHTQGSLFSAMKMEKTMIGLLLLMIVAVAAFNIIATLIMVVNDKGADIAILRTIGATPRQIMAIFMVQGTVIGIVGTLIGGVLGVIAALNVSQIGGLDRAGQRAAYLQFGCVFRQQPAVGIAGWGCAVDLLGGLYSELSGDGVSGVAGGEDRAGSRAEIFVSDSMLVPTLCVGTPQRTLRVRLWKGRGALGAACPRQSAGTRLKSP